MPPIPKQRAKKLAMKVPPEKADEEGLIGGYQCGGWSSAGGWQ
jgi:hypothetical protein